MCLDRVTERYDPVLPGVVMVSKRFRVRVQFNHDCTLPAHLHTMYGSVTPGRWQRATKGKIIGNGYLYPCGFHGNVPPKGTKPVTKKSSNGIMVYLPVKFRKVHTLGLQDGKPVYVAYEMLVPKNWKKLWYEAKKK